MFDDESKDTVSLVSGRTRMFHSDLRILISGYICTQSLQKALINPQPPSRVRPFVDIKAEFVDVDGTPCKMHADVIIFLPSTSHKWYETMVVHNGKQRVFFIGPGGVATHAARILEHIERVAGAKAAT